VTAFPSRLATATRWAVGRPILDEAYDAYLHEVRSRRSIPAVHGTVDAYPTAQGLILASGLQYRPRPAFQSYLTYTPELARLNTDFLTSPRAPDSILFDLAAIDGRFPPLEDAASWPLFLTHYNLTDASKSLLLLERAPHPRAFSLTAISRKEPWLGEWVSVPQPPDPVWATLDLTSTAIGKILTSIYKPPPVEIEFKLASGLINRFRLVPDVARGGFLLSPQVVDRTSFALLTSSDWMEQLRDSMVSQFRITVDGSDTSASYATRYDVTFSRLQYPRRDLAGVPGIGELLRFRQFVQHLRVVRATTPPQLLVIGDGRHVLFAPSGCQLLSAIPTRASAVRVTFGCLQPAGQDPAAGVAAVFKIYAAYPAPGDTFTAQPIWSRTLDPKVEGDRGLQAAEIRLPKPAPAAIVLETTAASEQGASYPCWADVEFR
jgi:hypothetical protein